MGADWGKYIGIPFKDCGRDLEEGFDCWGFVRYVAREELGYNWPSYLELYEKQSANASAAAAEDETWIEIPKEQRNKVKLGDVALFRYLRTQTHVALMLDHTNFIHLEEGHESSLGSISDPLIQRRLLRFYRWKS